MPMNRGAIEHLGHLQLNHERKVMFALLMRVFWTPQDLARYQLNKAIFCQLLLEAKIEETKARLSICDTRIIRLKNYLNEKSL
jgi:hypothetical protein